MGCNDDFFGGAFDFNGNGVTDCWERELAWEMMEKPWRDQLAQQQAGTAREDDDDSCNGSVFASGGYRPAFATKTSSGSAPALDPAILKEIRAVEAGDIDALPPITRAEYRGYAAVSVISVLGALVVAAMICAIPVMLLWAIFDISYHRTEDIIGSVIVGLICLTVIGGTFYGVVSVLISSVKEMVVRKKQYRKKEYPTD